MDLLEASLDLSNGEHLLWQVNRGFLSPLTMPEPSRLLTLPPGVLRWTVFEMSMGPQQTINLTATLGARSWVVALIASFSQSPGFKATFIDGATRRNIFGTTRELSKNVSGTARNPAWLSVPYEMEANSPLFIRATNLALVAATGELAVVSHMEGN